MTLNSIFSDSKEAYKISGTTALVVTVAFFLLLAGYWSFVEIPGQWPLLLLLFTPCLAVSSFSWHTLRHHTDPPSRAFLKSQLSSIRSAYLVFTVTLAYAALFTENPSSPAFLTQAIVPLSGLCLVYSLPYYLSTHALHLLEEEL